jgi:glutathione synthase/RimK-type ligase-like ATP-grasp enzyme
MGHPAVMVDTSDFPARSSLIERFGEAGARFELTVGGRQVDLASCRAGWWRRPLPYTLHDGIAPDAASFTYTECNEAMAGMWASLDIAWVNQPELDERAHHKPYQLALATELGLPIPETLVTNDPSAAADFIERFGVDQTVYKTFVATEENWRETRVLKPGELELLDQVRLAPVIFQELVPAVADLRVTVVGEEMFCAAITAAPDGYQIDYRMEMEQARFEPAELPAEVEKGLRALMERLGLIYGAIDMRLRPDGKHVFLEVNPAGEWLFVEERTGQRITEAMAKLLAQIDAR